MSDSVIEKSRHDYHDNIMASCSKKMKHGERELDLTEQVIEKLTCPICHKISRPPIKQCSNGHTICNGCWKKCPLCPICREKKKDIRALAVEQMAAGVFVSCDYEKDGCCEGDFLYKDLEEHYQNCLYHRVQCCPIDGCEETICMNIEGELVAHIESVHKVSTKDDCGDDVKVLHNGMRINKSNSSKYNKMGWSLVKYKERNFIVVSKQSNEMFSVTVTGLGKQNGFGKFFAEMRMRDKNNKVCMWKEEIYTSEERYISKMKKETCNSYFKIQTKDIIDKFARKNKVSANEDDREVEISFDIIITMYSSGSNKKAKT